jgi:Coenzyme PQQ synthesis protein D (PqqD)
MAHPRRPRGSYAAAVTGDRTAALLGPPRATVQALELDGDISLYDSATTRAVVLNATASAVWRLLDGSRDTAAVVDALAAEYGIAAAAIQADVERTLAELAATGMLESRQPARPSLPRP